MTTAVRGRDAREHRGAGQNITTGFVSVFPRQVGEHRTVLAYIPVPSGHPRLGRAAILGTLHAPHGLNLLGWATANETSSKAEDLARWLVCVGWSTRIVKHPDTLWIPAAAWSVDLTRSIDLTSSYCGHNRLCLGRLTLHDPEQQAQALAML